MFPWFLHISLHHKLNFKKGKTVHGLKTPRYFSSFEIHALKLQRLLGLSQQAEIRKAEKKKKSPASQAEENQEEDGKICLYGKSAPFHLVLGLVRDTRREITFEPVSNETQDLWLFLEGCNDFPEALSLQERKTEMGEQSLALMSLP